MNAEEAAALIARAKREFAEAAVARRPHLMALARQAVSGPEPHEAVRSLNQEAHQLHGTAGTLGFRDVSAAAQALESLTLLERADPEAIDRTCAELDAALSNLEAG